MPLTANKVRSFTDAELGVVEPADEKAASEEGGLEDLLSSLGGPEAPVAPIEPIAEDHPVYADVQAIRGLSYAGVLFVGPPGTSKSFWAARTALRLAGSADRVYTVQFHPSYQYEDFVEGYVPNETGGFKSVPKILLDICDAAAAESDKLFVLLIEELTRADAGRVFGEALTFIEPDKRGIGFRLSSGRNTRIPPNIFIIATLNSWDKGVEDLDIAFERRFGKLEFLPDRAALDSILAGKGAVAEHRALMLTFFDFLQKSKNPLCRLGHAYFQDCVDSKTASIVWRVGLLPLLKKVSRAEPDALRQIEAEWAKVVNPGPPAAEQGAQQAE